MKIAPALAAAAVLLVAGCSSAVSASDVEDQISSQYEEQVGEAPSSVACDEDLPAEVDASIVCDVETSDGTVIKTDVVVEKVDGSDVIFNIKPQKS